MRRHPRRASILCGSRRAFGTLLLGAVLLACAPAQARRGHGAPAGLRPGLYTISILAPTLDPALTIDEQTLHVCYTAAEAGAHANPIMPAAERKGCTSPDALVGNVLAYDATCKDGLHNLRLTQIGPESYVGKYLYVSKGQPRLQLEPAVRLHRDGDCP